MTIWLHGGFLKGWLYLKIKSILHWIKNIADQKFVDMFSIVYINLELQGSNSFWMAHYTCMCLGISSPMVSEVSWNNI